MGMGGMGGTTGKSRCTNSGRFAGSWSRRTGSGVGGVKRVDVIGHLAGRTPVVAAEVAYLVVNIHGNVLYPRVHKSRCLCPDRYAASMLGDPRDLHLVGIAGHP